MLAPILPPLKESPSSLTCNEHQGKSFPDIDQACFPIFLIAITHLPMHGGRVRAFSPRRCVFPYKVVQDDRRVLNMAQKD